MSQRPQQFQSKIRPQSGQSVVEYILLLVVVIGIASALLYRLFDPVKKFTDFYIGQYIDCLLDQGELPRLQGEEETQDCDYQAMTKGGLGGNGSKNGGSQNNGQNRNNTNSSGQNQKQSKENSESNSQEESMSNSSYRSRKRLGLGRSGSGSADYQGQSFQDSNKRLNLGDPGQEVKGGSSDSESGFSSNLASSNSSQIQRRRNRITRIRGLAGNFYAYETEKKERNKTPIRISNDTRKEKEEESGSGFEPRNKKLTMEIKSKKIKEIDISTDGWSFGKMFRIALIIIFILVIVWVVGSQLAQVSKNLE